MGDENGVPEREGVKRFVDPELADPDPATAGANDGDLAPGALKDGELAPGDPKDGELAPGDPKDGELAPGGHRDVDLPPGGHRDVDLPPGGHRDVDLPPGGHRDVDLPPGGPRDVDLPPGGPRDVDLPPGGPRDGDLPPGGPRDGDLPPGGPRDVDLPPGGPRDGPKDYEEADTAPVVVKPDSKPGTLSLVKDYASSLISRVLNYKLPRFDDPTAFSGDNPPICSQDFSDLYGSPYGQQFLLLAVLAAARGGDSAMSSIWTPFRRLLPRLQHLSAIANDVKNLKRLFGGLNRNVTDLEESCSHRFDELFAELKNLSSRHDGTLQQVLKAIEDAKTKESSEMKQAFAVLSDQLMKMQKKEISPTLNKLDEALKTGEIPIFLVKRLKEMRTELVTVSSYVVKLSSFLALYYANEVAPGVMNGKDQVKPEGGITPNADEVKDAELGASEQDACTYIYPPRMDAGLYKGIGWESKMLLNEGFSFESCAKVNMHTDSSERYRASFVASSEPKVDITLSCQNVVGHKLLAAFSFKNPSTFKAKVQCTSPYVGLNGSYMWNHGSDPMLKLGLTVCQGPYSVGGKVALESRKLKNFEYGVGASFCGRSAALKMLKGGVIKAGYHDQITKSTSTALEVKYTHTDKSLELAAGIQYVVDGNTKLKARVDSNGYGAAMMEHWISNVSVVSLAAKFNLSNLREDPKFGVCFEFKPSSTLPQSGTVATAGVTVNSKPPVGKGSPKT